MKKILWFGFFICLLYGLSYFLSYRKHLQNLKEYYHEATRTTRPVTPATNWPKTFYIFSDQPLTQHATLTVRANRGSNVVKIDPGQGMDFMQKNCPDYAHAYAAVRPLSFKSDIFRYCALWANGGVYIDDDFRADFNFKEEFGNMKGGLLLAQGRPYWNSKAYPFQPKYSKSGILTGFLVCRTKRHPVLQCALDRIKLNVEMKWVDRTLPSWPLTITGPSVLGNCITEKSDVAILGKFGTDFEFGLGSTNRCQNMHPDSDHCIYFRTTAQTISHIPIKRNTIHYSREKKIYN